MPSPQRLTSKLLAIHLRVEKGSRFLTGLSARFGMTKFHKIDFLLLKRIATAVVLIPIVMLLVLRAPVPVLAVLAAAVALVTVHEFLKLTESYGVQPLRLPTYIFVGLFFLLLAASAAGETRNSPRLKFVLGLGFARCARSIYFSNHRDAAGADERRVSGGGGLGVRLRSISPCPWQCWCSCASSGPGRSGFSICCSWFGRETSSLTSWAAPLGRHLMAPRISPKKTWEGAAASLVASLVVGTLLFDYALQISSFLLRVD